MILDLLVVFAGGRRIPGLLAILLGGYLDALLVLCNLKVFAVDLQNHIAAGTENAGDLPDGEPPDKRDGEDVKNPLRIRAHCAQHGDFKLQSHRGGVKGHKSKNDNEQTQAHKPPGHLTAAPAKHYLRPIPT